MNQSLFVLMAGQPGEQGLLSMLPMMLMMFGLIYLLMIRPQRKKQKEHEKLLTELKKGDKVVTNSGLLGTIFAIDEKEEHIILKTDGETKLRFLKGSIAAKIEK